MRKTQPSHRRLPRLLDSPAYTTRATELWRNHYWSEFNGYAHAFRDPWGNEIILWVRAGADPKVPSDYTRE